MQRIYEPENLLEGEMLLGMLASEGIEAHLLGQHLVGAVGELPACGLLGLLVAAPFAAAATAAVREAYVERWLEAESGSISPRA